MLPIVTRLSVQDWKDHEQQMPKLPNGGRNSEPCPRMYRENRPEKPMDKPRKSREGDPDLEGLEQQQQQQRKII